MWLETAARCHCAGRDGEHRLSFQVGIEQLKDVSLARSCRRLHHHTCPAVAAYSAEAAAKAGLAKEDLFPVATPALPPVATNREEPIPLQTRESFLEDVCSVACLQWS